MTPASSEHLIQCGTSDDAEDLPGDTAVRGGDAEVGPTGRGACVSGLAADAWGAGEFAEDGVGSDPGAVGGRDAVHGIQKWLEWPSVC